MLAPLASSLDVYRVTCTVLRSGGVFRIRHALLTLSRDVFSAREYRPRLRHCMHDGCSSLCAVKAVSICHMVAERERASYQPLGRVTSPGSRKGRRTRRPTLCTAKLCIKSSLECPQFPKRIPIPNCLSTPRVISQIELRSWSVASCSDRLFLRFLLSAGVDSVRVF